MNFYAYHEAKSKYAYMYDKDTLHLRLMITAGFSQTIEVVYGDPFSWGKNDIDQTNWEWKKDPSSPSFMKLETTLDGMDYYFVSIKPTIKRVKYAFLVNQRYLVSSRGIIDLTTTPQLKEDLFYYYNYPYLNEEDVFNAPSWVKNQVWYSIFPDRFRNGDSSFLKGNLLPWGETESYSNDQRFGGDLRGIIESIPYLVEVGFTGIYMTPIFVSDTSHKYDTIDYFKIDPAFGDNETFKELVEVAHQAGLKIMLDAVFNHCGFRHPFFQDVIEKGVESPYYDCFYIIDSSKPIVDSSYQLGEKFPRELAKKIHQGDAILNYRTFAFSAYMPKLNTANPVMKQYLLDVASYWIKEYDIDGWRLDVSNEVGHSFWRDFRKTVKGIKSDAYIVGENWDDAYPWLQGDQYDAVMNYGFMFPIHHFFGKSTLKSSRDFINQISRILALYPKNVIEAMYNLVDSHDTTRILEICGNNTALVKLPYVMMFSLPGAPSIYYGGEVGLTGKHDPDNRRCMPWGDKQNQDMLSFIKKMIVLRKNEENLKSTNLVFLESDNNTIFIKKNSLYIVLFNEFDPRNVKLPVEMSNKQYFDIFNDKSLFLKDTIDLYSYQFLIIKQPVTMSRDKL